MRIAAAWLSLLARNGAKASTGSFAGGGVVLSTLDGLPIANVLGVGAKVQMARAAALSDLELTAVLAHELGHMRLRHVLVFSLAFAALAAGLPWLVRKLALSESPADRRKRERDEAWNKDPYAPRDRSWVGATKAVIDATPREFAATGVSVVGIALAISAVQRFLECQADDYAVELVGTEPLISAISAFDAADTERNRHPGRKAAFWRVDTRFARGPIGRLFASAPSSESRIKRLRAKR
jgi:Zn-dependent protease with chaperone function